MSEPVFGPIPSRRLGRSLGVDPIPLKTCNWNCVYCQLGRTHKLINERAEYVPTEEILSAVRTALEENKGGIDTVTFVGSGEPTLHSKLGEMVRRVKEMTEIRVAVITNGSLLYLPEVREELMAADIVMPTLDAAEETLYRKLNRPHPKLTLPTLINGIKSFRKEFGGLVWLEVMLVSGMNDTEEALRALANVLQEIDPHEIHLHYPSRPPAEGWIEPYDPEGTMRALAILGDKAKFLTPLPKELEPKLAGDPLEVIPSLVQRHPLMEADFCRLMETRPAEEVKGALRQLSQEGKIRSIERFGKQFWTGIGPSYAGLKQAPTPSSPRRCVGSPGTTNEN